MRVEKLVVAGYQGLNYLNLEFTTPITLIAGKNATGKSSLRDAIKFVMVGDSDRVALKKDYGNLVRVGSDPKKAQIDMTVDGFTFTRKVATGKAGHGDRDTPLVLPHLLGSSRFAQLNNDEQTRLLYAVSRVKRDVPTVTAMMKERGLHPQAISHAATMLHAGFAPAVKGCKSEQSAARGRWEGITGDRFGEAKAVNWEAAMPDMIDTAEAREALADLNRTIPKMEAQLDKERATLAELTYEVQVAGALTCPCCDEKLAYIKGKLVKPETEISADEADQNRDAQAGVCELLVSELQKLQRSRADLAGQIAHIESAERECAARTKNAKEAFALYNAWKEAAEALSPGGIPLTLLEKGLIPINKHLAETSATAGWKSIVIRTDLEIEYGGIQYGLCSESEQWRIDAALAECFSRLSNVKLFILDRMDVLHPADRSSLLNWLIQIAPHHDSIFVMATLKTPPKGLPAPITPIWLDEGAIQQVEKAA